MIKPKNALVMDGDMFKTTIMQKGVLHMKATVYGKKAHGAYPWKGENAIEKSSKIIMDLKKHIFKFKPHPFVRPPTINIGVIKGGDRVNIVADECEFTIDMRFLPGMEPDRIISEIRNIIEKTSKNYALEITDMQMPYEIGKNNSLVNALDSALKKNNIKPKAVGSEGATVMTFFKNYEIPAVSFGIGPDVEHETDEYIEIESLVIGAKVLYDFLLEYK